MPARDRRRLQPDDERGRVRAASDSLDPDRVDESRYVLGIEVEMERDARAICTDEWPGG